MPISDEPPGGLTRGHLLGGRVRHDQPERGHRSGIEPVFLAAAVPARAGQRVLEAGTGTGAALLCLAFRAPGVAGVGVEQDPALARLAANNFQALEGARLTAIEADITRFSTTAPFDHALANPPWHAASGTVSPVPARALARRAEAGLLDAWVAALARALRHRGTLTLIAATHTVPEFLAALAPHGLGGPALLPLWPRRDVAAGLVLMQAVRGGRAPLRLLPGLVLHEADGRYTEAAERVLRHGAALPLRPDRSRNGPGTAPSARCTAPAPRA